MTTKEIKMESTRAMATMQAGTYNKEAGTFDVIFATENPIPAYQYEIGDFREILSCNPANVRMERALDGLPVFDCHFPRNAMVQLGIAENVRFEKGQGVATIRLGARCDEAMRSDIENGIIKGISAGYRVYAYMQEGEIKLNSTEIPTYRATDWEITEISFAPVQADPKSKIRSQETDGLHTVIINNLNLKQMADETIIPDAGRKLSDAPAAVVVDVAKIREDATKEVKARIDAILLSTRAAKLSDTEAIEYINGVDSIEKIRQSILEKFVSAEKVNTKADHSVVVGKEAIEKKRELAENAMLNRVDAKAFPLTEGSREYRGLQVHEIAKEFMAERGDNVRMLSKEAIADKIFNGQRDMSTGDFPLLLENVMNKSLRGDYNYAPEYWDLIAKETSVNDFKVKSMYQIESSNGMKQMADGEEINYGKLTEAKQTIKVESFGEGLQFTRRMFINDDLSAFSKIPSKFVLDWNTKRGDLVWGMLTANTDGVVMDDAKALFHTGHGNKLTGAGSALADAGLTSALKAFKAQTGIDGVRKIRVNPKYLIVSPDLEVAARKLLYVGVNPTQASEVNVWAGSYTLIVEPRLTGNIWYLAADPSSIEGLYYAYLNGNSGLRSNRVDSFKTDSIDFAVRGEFGVAAIDYRGWLKNVGA